MMKRLYLLPLACLGLGGCGTPIQFHATGDDEFVISGTSPGGMYGGFVGASPSIEAVKAKAEDLCPGGYEKTSEKSGAFFEGKFIEWRVRCHPQDKS
jgi:hypothetical protein